MEVVVNSTTPDYQASSAFCEKYQNGIKLYCDGITCHSCDDVIRHSLRDVPGIQNIDVDIPNKIVYISGPNPPLGRIIEEIETFGFSITILSRGAGGFSSAISSPNVTTPSNATPSTTSPSTPSEPNVKVENNGSPKSSAATSNGSGKHKNKEGDGSVIVQVNLIPADSSPSLSFVEKANFTVEGMTCASCVHLIETMASEIPGIMTISVNLLAAKASISYDSKFITPEKICEEISDIGFKTTEIMGSKPGALHLAFSLCICFICLLLGSITLLIDELNIENQDEVITTLQNLDGILGVALEQCGAHEHSIACVKYDENVMKGRDVIKMVNERTSFTAHYHQFNNSLEAMSRKKEILYYRNMTIISFIFAIPTFVIAMILGTRL
jgi:Cu+-exporting ATPase